MNGGHIDPGRRFASGTGSHRGGHLPTGYRLLHTVGSGRYASVHLCQAEASRSEVAVKLFGPTVSDPRRRLAAHSELLSAGAAARHPCAVTVRDAGFTEDQRPFLVADFCPGGSAHQRLLTSGPFGLDDALTLGVRLALALHSSHRHGVLHLDVRPANVLFDAHGEPLLADHGVSRVLQRCVPGLGALIDPRYAAREMFGWEMPGPAADVYGLGATLYTLLAGEPAYGEAGHAGRAALQQRPAEGEVPPLDRPDVPAPLSALLRRMMAIQASDRPPLTEVHHELRRALPHSCASRIPQREPEPAPDLPLPGWDPAEDVAPQEVDRSDDEQDGADTDQALRRRHRHRLVAASGATVVFVVVAAILTLSLRSGNNDAQGPQPQVEDTRHTLGEEEAQQVPRRDLPRLRPRDVTATREGGSVQLVWQAPAQSDAVAYYLATAVEPNGGAVLSTQSTTADERQVAFTLPPVRADSCYLVSAVVGSDAGNLKLAPAPEICPDKGNG